MSIYKNSNKVTPTIHFATFTSEQSEQELQDIRDQQKQFWREIKKKHKILLHS